MGAPVIFMGVTIGGVKDIDVIENPSKSSFFIQVLVELISGKVKKFITKEFGSAKEIYKYAIDLWDRL